MSDAQAQAVLRAEAGKARALLNNEYFQTVTREMEIVAMEQAIVGADDAVRASARIEVLMLRKLHGYLEAIAGSFDDNAAAQRQARASE